MRQFFSSAGKWFAYSMGIMCLIVIYFIFLAPHVYATKEECTQVLKGTEVSVTNTSPKVAERMAKLTSQYLEQDKLSWYQVLICKQ